MRKCRFDRNDLPYIRTRDGNHTRKFVQIRLLWGNFVNCGCVSVLEIETYITLWVYLVLAKYLIDIRMDIRIDIRQTRNFFS